MKGKLNENKYTTLEPYSFPNMKKKLKEYFGDKITITDIHGKQNVTTSSSTASATLQHFYEQQKNEDAEKEKLRLVEAAAKIMKNDKKKMTIIN